MKRKEYKVIMKLIYETSYVHSDTSMEKAKKYFEEIFRQYIDNGNDIRDFFEEEPDIRLKVVKYDRKQKN